MTTLKNTLQENTLQQLAIIALVYCTITLASLQLNAQNDYYKGYIISTNNDTIKGWVKKELNHLSFDVLFKQSMADAATSYTPRMLKGFYSDVDGVYRADKVSVYELGSEEEVFLKCLIRGEQSLYTWIDNNGEEYFYLSNEDVEMQELIYYKDKVKDEKNGKEYIKTVKRYIGVLNLAFQECPKIQKRIAKMSYVSKSALMDIFEKYHECVGAEYENLNKEFKKVRKSVSLKKRLDLGLVLGGYGGIINKDKFFYNTEEEFELAFGSNFGCSVNCFLPNLDNRFSVEGRFMMIQTQHHRDANELPSNESLDPVWNPQLQVWLNAYKKIGKLGEQVIIPKIGQSYDFRFNTIESLLGIGCELGKGRKSRMEISLEYKFYHLLKELDDFYTKDRLTLNLIISPF